MHDFNASLQFVAFQDVDIDWSKALFSQVGKLGPKYVEWVHSPVNCPL